MINLLLALCLWTPLNRHDVGVVVIAPDCTAFRLDASQLDGLRRAGIQVSVYTPTSVQGQEYVTQYGLRTLPYYILFVDDPNDRVVKFRPVVWGTDIAMLVTFLRAYMIQEI